MTVGLTINVSPGLEWGVESDSRGSNQGPHICIPAKDIQHLTDSEIGALARTLVEKAYFAAALNFADNVRHNSGESKHVDDIVIERYGDDIALLERFAGQDESIDSALEKIQNTKQRIAERVQKVSRRKKVSPVRREIQMSYDSIFVSIGRRDGFHCQHCETTTDLQIDHIHPVSRGGGNQLDNLQLLCKTCNGRKGNDI